MLHSESGAILESKTPTVHLSQETNHTLLKLPYPTPTLCSSHFSSFPGHRLCQHLVQAKPVGISLHTGSNDVKYLGVKETKLNCPGIKSRSTTAILAVSQGHQLRQHPAQVQPIGVELYKRHTTCALMHADVGC